MRQPKCSKAYICRGAKSSPFQIEGSYKMKIAHRAAAAGARSPLFPPVRGAGQAARSAETGVAQ